MKKKETDKFVFQPGKLYKSVYEKNGSHFFICLRREKQKITNENLAICFSLRDHILRYWTDDYLKTYVIALVE